MTSGATAPPNDRYFYSPPGNLPDLQKHESARANWSKALDGIIEDIIADRKKSQTKLHFYNPARQANSTAQDTAVKWLAFPNNCGLKAKITGQDKYVEADKRLNQDEYCEWEVKKENGELKSVTFTTETPEVRPQTDVQRLSAILLSRASTDRDSTGSTWQAVTSKAI